jgi:hypothetical protein
VLLLSCGQPETGEIQNKREQRNDQMKQKESPLVLRGYSPESTVTRNEQGKDNAALRHAWRAKWITHPAASTLDYGVFLFRRTFELKEQPERFIVFVSADNRYRLFVNGEAVCSGPALGDLGHWRYETLDLARWLRKGSNVLAAEVVNFGEYRRGAQQTFQTAFILQGPEGEGASINTGEEGWKVIRNGAYDYIPFLPSDLQAYYCAGPGDKVDGKRYPWGWQQPGYDDAGWLTPRPATVEFAAGRGFLYGSTWFLVPREIPLMEESPQRFDRVVRAGGVQVPEGFLQGTAPLTVPPRTKALLLLDQRVHTVAFPELTVSGGEGSRIKITYAEALLRPLPADSSQSDGHMLSIDRKGNRNETGGKEIFGVYDIFCPGGGEKRLFRPLAKRTFRYVQLDIETGEDPLTLEDFSSVYTAYPFREVASFRCDDPELEKIWEVAWRTLRNGADETFYDTPYYEQLQYVGDTRLSSLVSLCVSGDDRLMRKAIALFDDSRTPEGLTQSRYPSYIKQIIPPFSLFWTGMVHDYFLYRDDTAFVRRFLPGIRGVLEWFEQRIDEEGMVARTEWWNFTDWVAAFSNGIPPGADDGHSANINMQYLCALKDAVELFRYYGWDREAARYSRLAESIGEAVRRCCYDGQKGLFAETAEKKVFSQHTNVMAVLADVVEEPLQRKIMERILSDTGVVEATLYFKFYLFRALRKTGMADRYLDELGPWRRMLALGLTTFPETDGVTRSDCHPWSSTPCFDLLGTVAGISPAEPGFKKVDIAPAFGYLKRIEAQMPHPAGGLISVSLQKDDNGRISGSVTLPEEVRGVFRWNNKEYPLSPGLQKIAY